MSTVFQGNRKLWTMLSKNERRILIVNSLSIPMYLRFYLADQTRDTFAKRHFHASVEFAVKDSEEPDLEHLKNVVNKAAGSPFKKFWLFVRFIFTRS